MTADRKYPSSLQDMFWFIEMFNIYPFNQCLTTGGDEGEKGTY